MKTGIKKEEQRGGGFQAEQGWELGAMILNALQKKTWEVGERESELELW